MNRWPLLIPQLRESRPQLFFSRVVNKAWYGIFGAEDIIKVSTQKKQTINFFWLSRAS
jgi:Diacylglycerol kinase accessory domain